MVCLVIIIIRPTLTASKWWIGMAGETATHTVAIARLIVDNKDLGLNWYTNLSESRACRFVVTSR